MTRRKAWLLILAVVVAGCATPSGSPGSATSSASTDRPTPGATPTATRAPILEPAVPPLTPHSTATVATGHLQIRAGPGMEYQVLLPAEWKHRAAGTKVTLHDGLVQGDVIGVEGGAIAQDGQRWYMVTPFAPEGSYDAWVDPEDPETGLDGWVPWVDEDSPTLVMADVVHEPAVAWYGLGEAELAEVARLDRPGMYWYAASSAPSQDCHFRVVLPATEAVLVEEHIRGWGRGSAIWPDFATGARFETTCAWAFDILTGTQ